MVKKKTENAEKTDKNNDSFYGELASATGGELLSNCGKTKYFVDTGNLALNYICSGKFFGGGIPGGKIIEVFGPPASSKSLLANCVLAATQRMGGVAGLIDTEHAANAEFARIAAHVDPEKLLHLDKIYSIEQVEKKLIAAIKFIRQRKGADIPIVFVWDSISTTPTEREFKETDLPENASKQEIKDAGGNARPGERAKAAGDMLRKINPFLDANNATLFIINQIRKNIGDPWNPITTSGGGMALPFYASLRLETDARKKIEDEKRGVPIGVNLVFKNKKNRSTTPFLETKGVKLYYDRGIDPISGILSVLIGSGRVVVNGKGSFKILQQYVSGKDEYTFRSSLERNDIAMKVLLDNPKLVDAVDEQQVKDYFELFHQAIALSNSSDIIEKDVLADGEEETVASKLGLVE